MPSTHTSYSALFGRVAITLGWAPPIRYLLRRARILRLLKSIPKGYAVEVGCGAGALLEDFNRLGFKTTGLETSQAARDKAHALAALTKINTSIVSDSSSAWNNKIDLVCAFDVLEHIENDQEALQQWCSWLKPHGLLMISVPAHTHRWGAGDIWAGHWRRYDKAQLLDILQKQNIEIIHFECYGFPLANLTELLGNRVYLKLLSQRSNEGSSNKEAATAQSGIEREPAIKIFSKLNNPLGKLSLYLNFFLQHITAKTNLGSGYLVLARKRLN